MIRRFISKFPNIREQKMIKCFDMIFENVFRFHIRSYIEVIYAVKRIQFDCISFEMPCKKRCVYSVFSFLSFSLDIIQKYGEMRCFRICKTVVEKLINENFVKAVFAGSLD